MGLGHLNRATGEINLLVSFRFPLPASAQAQWFEALKLAAARFHAATRQKLRIVRISWGSTEDGVSTAGLHAADLVIHPSLEQKGYAYLNRFSRRGGNANVGQNFGFSDVHETIVHELGHYLLNVSDEYRTDWFELEIDRDVELDSLIAEAAFPVPNGADVPLADLRARIIPLISGQQIPAAFSFVRARIGNDIQSRIMFEVADTYMTTNAPFSKVDGNGDIVNVVPQTDAESPVYGFEDSGCASTCIMQDASYDGSSSGNDLFCRVDNHVSGFANLPDNTNAQHALHQQSCWQALSETLIDEHGFDINAAPVITYADPEFVELLPQRRLALVFDRSGSMASSGKMDAARQAAQVWLSTYVAGEYVALSWYNTAPQTTQALTELTLGSAGDFAAQLDVPPQGGTNIRDALFEGLDQLLSGAPGVAAVNAVILMTDGLHNHPGNSDAREVIDSFKQNHIPIYSVGFGPSEEVDMALLDDLAGATGGVAYASSQVDFIEAVLRISFELRSGLVLDWQGELGASKPTADIRRPTVARGIKPNLLKLLADNQLSDFRIKPNGRPARNRAVSIPVVVEPGSVRAFFFWRKRNRKDDAWFYLLDPDNDPIDFNSLGKAHFEKDGITQVVIEKPAPGTWHMMIVKDDSDPGITRYSAMAASENPRLNVYGDAGKENAKGAPVRIWANANWVEPLSQLKVSAEITAPNGRKSTVELHEPAGDLRRRGLYEGIYLPTASGRYTGKLCIANVGKASKALAGSHPAHDELKVDEKSRINVAADAPRFVRYINFYFNSGAHPKPVDKD